MATVYLISCVKQKDETPGKKRARDLYTSPYFRKMRALAEQQADRWYILSDHYGLLAPDDEISWYEVDLKGMSAPRKGAWARRVIEQLVTELTRGDEIVMLAGSTYFALLGPDIRARGFRLQEPMHGLRIGERMSWLEGQLRA